jgi:hypothetical protein
LTIRRAEVQTFINWALRVLKEENIHGFLTRDGANQYLGTAPSSALPKESKEETDTTAISQG